MIKQLCVFLLFCAVVSCAGGSVTMNQYNQLMDDYNTAVRTNNDNAALFHKFTAACEETYNTLEKCMVTLDAITDNCVCDCHEPTKQERTQGL